MTELAENKEVNTDSKRPSGPGTGTLIALLAILGGGSLPLAIFAKSWDAWPTGALVGFALSGLLALCGWWATRRAFGADHSTFMKNVFGFMGLRLLLAGVVAGLVIGFGWLHADGFVIGLFGGVVVFQAIEIGGVLAAAKRAAPPLSGNHKPVQGATGNAN